PGPPHRADPTWPGPPGGKNSLAESVSPWCGHRVGENCPVSSHRENHPGRTDRGTIKCSDTAVTLVRATLPVEKGGGCQASRTGDACRIAVEAGGETLVVPPRMSLHCPSETALWRKKKQSRFRARSFKPLPTRSSECGWTAATRSLPSSPAKSARTSSASCPATSSPWQSLPTTSARVASPTAGPCGNVRPTRRPQNRKPVSEQRGTRAPLRGEGRSLLLLAPQLQHPPQRRVFPIRQVGRRAQRLLTQLLIADHVEDAHPGVLLRV